MPSHTTASKAKSSPNTRDTNAKDDANFHPSQITPSTFAKLLGCYPQTVKNVRRNKAIAKIKSKTEKGAKRKADTKPMMHDAEELSASDEKIVTDEVNQYLDLDRWRYETLPELVRKRKNQDQDQDEGEGVVEVLGKEDVEGIMEWKL